MVSDAYLNEAAAIVAQVAQGPARVVVVPASLSVGTAENPAICIKKTLTLNWVRNQMGADEVLKYVGQDARGTWDNLRTNLALDDIVVSEGVFEKALAYKSAVVWHEYGHVLHGSAESGDVYHYEVNELTNRQAQIGGQQAVRTVLQGRVPSYRKAVDPGVATLRGLLANTWQIQI
jgi:hypothetical protein